MFPFAGYMLVRTSLLSSPRQRSARCWRGAESDREWTPRYTPGLVSAVHGLTYFATKLRNSGACNATRCTEVRAALHELRGWLAATSEDRHRGLWNLERAVGGAYREAPPPPHVEEATLSYERLSLRLTLLLSQNAATTP